MRCLNAPFRKLLRYIPRMVYEVILACLVIQIYMRKDMFLSSLYTIVTLFCFIDNMTMDYNTSLLIYLAGLSVSLSYGR